MMRVSEVTIDDEYITVQGGDNIIDVAKKIAKSSVPDAVVIGENGIVLGSLDDYDIVSKVLAEELNPAEVKAEDIMYVPPPIKPTTELTEVQETMKKLDVTMLPVTDDNKKLLGVVTIMDVMEGLAYSEYQSRTFVGSIKRLFGK